MDEDRLEKVFKHVDTFEERQTALLKRFDDMESRIKEWIVIFFNEQIRQAKLHEKPSEETLAMLRDIRNKNSRVFIAGLIFGVICGVILAQFLLGL